MAIITPNDCITFRAVSCPDSAAECKYPYVFELNASPAKKIEPFPAAYTGLSSSFNELNPTL
jgi:hypothetical protein